MGLPIGQFLLDRLQQLGVQHIFGVPGDYILQFNKMIEQHSIQFINTTQENTAGYMADAYARLRGLGVACITYGVGISIANALAQAYVESSPIVIISGAAGTEEYSKCRNLHHLINRTQKHLDFTQLEIFKQLTIAQAVIDDVESAESKIDHTLEMCLKHKKPVYIELPRNFIAKPIIAKPMSKHKKTFPNAIQPPQNEIQNVKTALQNSKRPVIWAGHEIQRFGLSKQLLDFAERHHIPIVSSLLGKTVISERHPLFVGVYQGGISRPEVSKFVESCDCIFVLGTILSDVETGIFSAKIPSTSVVANAESGDFVSFMNALAQLPLIQQFSHPFPKREIPKFAPKSRTKITTARMFECIQHHLTPEHIVVTDIGDALFGSEDLILEQNSFFSSAYFETLGFGTPGAIAAQLAAPKRRVIGIVGDGGFQMTAMELSTAVRYHLDPIIIVMNNHGYGTERPLIEGTYNDIQDWNYAKIPDVLQGGVGIEVRTEEDFDKALKAALAQRGSYSLIEVELEKTDFSPTMLRFINLAKNTLRINVESSTQNQRGGAEAWRRREK